MFSLEWEGGVDRPTTSNSNISSIALQVMQSRPYNNFPFLVDVIRFAQLFPDLGLIALSELTRQSQAISSMTTDCQFYSQRLANELHSVGVEASFVDLHDQSGEHVMVQAMIGAFPNLFDLTFGLYQLLAPDSTIVIKNSKFTHTDNQFSFSLDINGDGQSIFNKSFDIDGVSAAKVPYYYTARNFPATRFIGSIWQFDQHGNQVGEIALTIKKDKSIKLTLQNKTVTFTQKIEEVDFISSDFIADFDKVWSGFSNTDKAYSRESIMRDLIYIQQNIQILKKLKLDNYPPKLINPQAHLRASSNSSTLV